MATNTDKCSIVGQAHYRGGSVGSYDTSASKYAGYISSTKAYWVCVFKFKTPAYAGVPEKLSFQFGVSQVTGTQCTLRYALCTSDKNSGDYTDTYDSVSDSTQIEKGTLSVTGLSGTSKKVSLEIETSKLKPSTAYYLYFWAASTNVYTGGALAFDAAKNQSVTISYTGGIVHLSDGTNLNMYQVYIDNGTSVDLYIPYVDNGSSWDMCGS